MSKKKQKARVNIKERDAPSEKRSGVMLTSTQSYDMFTCGGGYRSLDKCPEITACINAYADTISNMTIHLMENTELGDRRITNELSRLVDIQPCKTMTRKSWLYNIVKTMMLTGNGNQVTLVESDGVYITDMIPVPPSHVSFIDYGYADYAIIVDGKRYNPDELLHFVYNPDPDRPWIGMGIKAQLNDIIKCLSQASITKQALMKSPAPSIIVKVDGLTEEFASVGGRKKLREQYIDASENGEPWMIPAEAFSIETVKPLTINDLAIKDNLELDRREVAAVLGVPPFMVGVGEYKEDAYNAFINGRAMGVAQIIQQTLTKGLLAKKEWYFKLNPRSLYNYKLPDLITAGSQMVDRNAMLRNEWRDWVGLSPREDMQTQLALENYIPVDRLGDQKKLNGDGGEE